MLSNLKHKNKEYFGRLGCYAVSIAKYLSNCFTDYAATETSYPTQLNLIILRSGDRAA